MCRLCNILNKPQSALPKVCTTKSSCKHRACASLHLSQQLIIGLCFHSIKDARVLRSLCPVPRAPCPVPRNCLALLSHIRSQLQKAVLQLLWSWTPGWIQTTCTSLAHFWYSTGKEDPAAAPPRRASFAFGSFLISKIIRIAVSRCTALLLDGSCACLALLCHIRSQLQKAALHLLWSWAPGWIQTSFTILSFLWQNTGKKGPAAAPPETASFGFGDFIVVIVRRVRTCPSGVPPRSSGTPGGAMSDEDKSGMPDTQYAGGGGNQKAIQVGFSLVILCWYWPAGICLAPLMLLSCLPACS